jgi:hypothetical protein
MKKLKENDIEFMAIELLLNLRDSLLPKLMSGEVRVDNVKPLI